MHEIKAPIIAKEFDPGKHTSVFLAGSIEMGVAEQWQTKVAKQLKKSKMVDYVFNPRRDDWDSSWIQSKDNPQFHKQVSWELDHIQKSDAVFFYFDPSTQSPITLLELGLCLQVNRNIVVVCPDGYFRKGNVEITCNRFDVTVHNSIDIGLIDLLHKLAN